jgi:hypothetical protein
VAELEPLAACPEVRAALEAMLREYDADPWGMGLRRIYARLWLEWSIGVASEQRPAVRAKLALSAKYARQRYDEKVAEDRAADAAPREPSPSQPGATTPHRAGTDRPEAPCETKDRGHK